MHGLGAGFLAGSDNALAHQITFGCRRRADMHRLVGHFDMQRVAVGIGIDGNRRDAHAPGGLDNPAGNFAAIGNQNFLEHSAATLLRRFRFMDGFWSVKAHLYIATGQIDRFVAFPMPATRAVRLDQAGES